MDSVPSFYKTNVIIHVLEEISNFRVEAKPLGFRGIRCLRWLLQLTPYITGSKPKFRIQVTRVASSTNNPFHITLYRRSNGHDCLVLQTQMISVNFYNEDFQDEPLSASAQYSYILEVTETPHSPVRTELVSFRTIYQETITMSVVSIIIGFLISLITWLITSRGH